MKRSEAIAYFGGNASELARALGMDQSSIHSWKNDRIPLGRQFQLELLTKGALKADKPTAKPRKAAKAS